MGNRYKYILFYFLFYGFPGISSQYGGCTCKSGTSVTEIVSFLTFNYINNILNSLTFKIKHYTISYLNSNYVNTFKERESRIICVFNFAFCS